MKKFLQIVFLSLLLASNANGATATCANGECEFYLSTHYATAKSSCYQTLFDEEVITSLTTFTIIETKEVCVVWDSK